MTSMGGFVQGRQINRSSPTPSNGPKPNRPDLQERVAAGQNARVSRNEMKTAKQRPTPQRARVQVNNHPQAQDFTRGEIMPPPNSVRYDENAATRDPYEASEFGEETVSDATFQSGLHGENYRRTEPDEDPQFGAHGGSIGYDAKGNPIYDDQNAEYSEDGDGQQAGSERSSRSGNEGDSESDGDEENEEPQEEDPEELMRRAVGMQLRFEGDQSYPSTTSGQQTEVSIQAPIVSTKQVPTNDLRRHVGVNQAQQRIQPIQIKSQPNHILPVTTGQPAQVQQPIVQHHVQSQPPQNYPHQSVIPKGYITVPANKQQAQHIPRRQAHPANPAPIKPQGKRNVPATNANTIQEHPYEHQPKTTTQSQVKGPVSVIGPTADLVSKQPILNQHRAGMIEQELHPGHSEINQDVPKEDDQSVLDYDEEHLKSMPYSHLAVEAFDHNPKPAGTVLSAEVAEASLEERLQYAREHLVPEQQIEFFNSLNLDDWDQAGAWFIDRFSEVMKNMVKLRKRRRETATEFEAEIEKRDENVQRKCRRIDKELGSLKSGGMSLLQSPRVNRRQ